jgi:hypothetical protein
MAQAVVAVSLETDRSSDAKNTLLDLLMGTVTRAESELTNTAAVSTLLNFLSTWGQAQGDRQAWRLFAELEVDEDLAVHLAETFDRLSSASQKQAPTKYFAEIAKSFGYVRDEDVPFVFQILAMHASTTMVTIYQDTIDSPEKERDERRMWAAFYEGMMIATWRSWERLAVKHDKSLRYVSRL